MAFWLNGVFRDERRAIDISDRGFLLGDGVFETLLVERGVAAFFTEHLARLKHALAALKINAPLDDASTEIIRELASRNGCADKTASARITVSRGAGGRGLPVPDGDQAKPTMLITVSAYAPNSVASPVTLLRSRHIRSETSITARYKTLNYLDNIIARDEAISGGADEAVMINNKDNIACASSANIFCIGDDGAIETPPCSEGALDGIVRGLLLANASDIGAEISEASMSIAALGQRQLFVTNSLIGIRQAEMFDSPSRTRAGKAEMLHRLQAWYANILMADLEKRAAAL